MVLQQVEQVDLEVVDQVVAQMELEVLENLTFVLYQGPM